ncbi:hypothetical protein, partial [Shewanella sairae]|uniref:hypothetical protein n=1 Tax=Shewanella sairae TaxID=190310 RepID=UPI001C80BC47
MKYVLTIFCKTLLIFIACVFGSVVAYAAAPKVPSISVPSSDVDGRYTVTWGETSNTTRYEIMGEMSGTLY